MATCPTCHRPYIEPERSTDSPFYHPDRCWGPGAYACHVAAQAYARGVHDGVESVKREAKRLGYIDPEWGIRNSADWTDVAREVEKLTRDW